MLAALVFLLFLQKADHAGEGLKALEAKNYAAAVEAFQKAVEAAPGDYSAHFHLALAHSLLDQNSEAIKSYEKVLELKPELYEAELNLGIVLLRARQAPGAVRRLEAAAKQKPTVFSPNFFLAEALLAADQPERAAQAFQTALEIDPKSAPSEAGLGRALARQGKLAEAEPHYRKAAGIDTSYEDSLLELAALFEKNKQPAEAIAIYQRFAAQPAVSERLGALLLEAGRSEEAIPPLQQAVQASPTPANRFALATAYLRAKQPDKALPLLQLAAQAEPANSGLRMTYGRALRDQKNYQGAAREFWSVAQAKPDFKDAWSELAAMLILLENYPQALAALDRVEALGETGAAIHYFRAIVLDRLQQYKPALAAYQKFLSMSENQHPDEEFKARQRVRTSRRS
jgi:tetratricopeptide (TPR) repeat protein